MQALAKKNFFYSTPQKKYLTNSKRIHPRLLRTFNPVRRANQSPVSEDLRSWREAEERIETSTGLSSIRTFFASSNPESADWDIFHHGFPGTSLEFYRLPSLLSKDRNVLLIDGPGHLNSEAPRGRWPFGFRHTIGDYAQHIHEILQAKGLNSPSVNAHFSGHSVGALILMYYTLMVTHRGDNTPSMKTLNLMAPLGQLVRPYKRGIDTHRWGFNELGAMISRWTTRTFNGGEKDVGDSYDLAFGKGWKENMYLTEYFRENKKFWLRPDGKKLTQNAADLVTGTSRSEFFILQSGQKYPYYVLRKLGIVPRGIRRVILMDIMGSLFRRTGAHFNVVIPKRDEVYFPHAQRGFAEDLERRLQVPVTVTKIDSVHGHPIDNPRETVKAIGYKAA